MAQKINVLFIAKKFVIGIFYWHFFLLSFFLQFLDSLKEHFQRITYQPSRILTVKWVSFNWWFLFFASYYIVLDSNGAHCKHVTLYWWFKIIGIDCANMLCMNGLWMTSIRLWAPIMSLTPTCLWCFYSVILQTSIINFISLFNY